MELRPPPTPAHRPRPDRLVRSLLAVAVLLLAAILGLLGLRGDTPRGDDPERVRQVAARLQAAGLRDEAATLYGQVLASPGLSPAERARIAYSLGAGFLEAGRPESALRWLYEAESWDDGELAEEIGPKIVHALERLGRHHAAQTALERRSGLGEGGERRRAPTDPVVARIGSREVTRSEVDRALDDLPPQLAQRFQGVEGRREFLRSYVAEELLWEKAQKLEYHDDPEVRRGHEQLLRQLAVARFVEREVLGKIEVDEDDLANFFAAHRERYAPPSKEGEESVPPTLEQVRPAVERDYRLMKTQSATAELIDSELAAAGVELFPERLTDAQ